MAKWSDVVGVITKIAPTIGSAVGGPLVGSAITAIEGAFGVNKSSDDIDKRKDSVAAAIAGATPEQMLALKQADNDFAAKMQQLGFENQQALEQLAVQDRESARQFNLASKNSWIPSIVGCVIVFGVLGIAAGVLFGEMKAESALAGAVIGYLFNEASSVTKFWYGGSRATDRQTELLAQSAPVTTAGAK
jgi:hypothetical protein